MGNRGQVRFVFGAVIFAATVCSAALPAGYTELPYLESTYNGKQWVYTDYVPDGKHRIVTKFRVNQVGSWDSPGVYCARGTANNDRGYCLYMGQGGNPRPNLPGALGLFTGDWSAPTVAPYYYPDLATDYEVDVNYEFKKWRVNGGEDWSTRGKSVFTAGSPLAIFCTHTLGASLSPSSTFTASYCLAGRIYYLRVYDADGQLIHEFVPARDDNATVASKYFGFYDTVDGKFWPNCGANAFKTDSAYFQTRVVDRAAYATDADAGAALVATAAAAFPTDHIKLTAGTKAAPHVYKIAAPVVLATTGIALEGGSDDAETSVIDAGDASAGVVVTGSGIVVSGVTVKNAVTYMNGSTPCAGGIAATVAGTLVTNCVVRNCRNCGTEADLRGSGVYMNGGRLVGTLVESCVATNLHASAGKQDSYGGGVYAENGAKVKGVEVRQCVGYNGQHSASGWDTGNMFGAGLSLNGTGTAGEGCFVHHNRMECDLGHVGGDVNWGAGVFVGSGAQFKNSLVLTNISCNSYAGVCAGALASVSGCTIAGNEIAIVRTGVAAAGIGTPSESAGSKISNCLIEGNRNRPDDWDSCGGGSAFTAEKLSGCVWRDNWCGHGDGQAVVIKGAAVSISNCVFDANGVTSGGYGALCFRQCAKGSEIRDCWFVNNKCSANEQGSAVNTDIRKAAEGGKLVNCFFAYNGGGCVVGGSDNSTEAEIAFENCTFVSNNVSRSIVSSDGVWWKAADKIKLPYSQYFKNCAFWGNYNKPVLDAKYAACSNTVYCYADKATGLPSDPTIDFHNLTSADGEPRYRNPAAGDWRFKKTSVLRESGTALGWMSGAQDLGDGTWTEKPAAKITVRGQTFDAGVIVTRRNARSRVSPRNGAPDIGCTEYGKSGAIVILR